MMDAAQRTEALRAFDALKTLASWQAYAVAVVTVSIATGLRLLLNELLQTNYVFGVFYVAVAVSAWFGGLRGGILATSLAGAATLYVIAAGQGEFTLSTADQVEWALFLVFSVVATFLFESLEKARRETAQARETLSALIDVAPVGIALFDQGMRYTLVNDALARVNGIPAEAHKGRTPAELLPDVAPNVERVFREVMVTGRAVPAVEFEAETPATGGIKRVWLEAWFPVFDGAGRARGVGALVHDVTAERAAEKSLREADRHKDHFLAMLSHELRQCAVPVEHGFAGRKQQQSHAAATRSRAVDSASAARADGKAGR
jgi:PAS domain S-box-containing protein